MIMWQFLIISPTDICLKDSHFSSLSLLDSIKHNKIENYDSVSTWDFSTLYTSIPHSDLLHRLKKLIKLTFDKNNGSNLLVNDRNAYFSNEDKDGYLSFSCIDFCKLFEFLTENIYINLWT